MMLCVFAPINLCFDSIVRILRIYSCRLSKYHASAIDLEYSNCNDYHVYLMAMIFFIPCHLLFIFIYLSYVRVTLYER